MIDALHAASAPVLRAWIEENRARVVAVLQQAGKAGGGGSTMPAKSPKITLGKTEGPSDDRGAPILLDGAEIGELVVRKQINFRPAKRIDFAAVTVTLWEPYDYEATFDARTYGDATTARRAALAAVRDYVAASA